MVFAFFLRRHSVFQELISQKISFSKIATFFQGSVFILGNYSCTVEGWKIGKVFELVLRYYIFSVCFYRFFDRMVLTGH